MRRMLHKHFWESSTLLSTVFIPLEVKGTSQNGFLSTTPQLNYTLLASTDQCVTKPRCSEVKSVRLDLWHKFVTHKST